MNQFQPLIDDIFRSKVLRARALKPSERMAEVLELSSMYFSEDDPELRRRLSVVRAMEEHGCYAPPEPRL